ncbi:hypothetical protein CRG98_001088 [Punica granatum]|uniref:Dienelactone hydrolase domain-containing protein n=1 Tax=Punica granatum TaxID=22663 RepID=A0A2I0LCY4_PUNGR|nr:hypothetical protein CRG98_001088 [Punica granatum]
MGRSMTSPVLRLTSLVLPIPSSPSSSYPMLSVMKRRISDKVAAAGYLVVVPDFLYGDPVDLNKPDFSVEAWLKLHSPDKGCEDAKLVIAALKAKGVCAIGVAGFCWGGMVLAKLASSDDIRAAVILHPGKITKDEIEAVKIPTAILGAENDHIVPPEELEKLGEILSAKSELESYVKIFPGVSHGWSVRYKLEDESAVRSAEEAHLDMLDWFQKHVK